METLDSTTIKNSDYNTLKIVSENIKNKVPMFLENVIIGLNKQNSEPNSNNKTLEEISGLLVDFPGNITQCGLENTVYVENKYFNAKIKVEICNFDHFLKIENHEGQKENFDGVVFLVDEAEINDSRFGSVISLLNANITEESAMSLLFIDTYKKDGVDLEEFYDKIGIYIEQTSGDVSNFVWKDESTTEQNKNNFDDKEGIERLVELIRNTTWKNTTSKPLESKVEKKPINGPKSENDHDLTEKEKKDLAKENDLLKKMSEDKKIKEKDTINKIEKDLEKMKHDEYDDEDMEGFEQENDVFMQQMGDMMKFKEDSKGMDDVKRRQAAADMMMKLCKFDDI